MASANHDRLRDFWRNLYSNNRSIISGNVTSGGTTYSSGTVTIDNYVNCLSSVAHNYISSSIGVMSTGSSMTASFYNTLKKSSIIYNFLQCGKCLLLISI